MYELFTLDFFKTHSAKANADERNIVLGNYEDFSLNHITSVEEAEKLLSVSKMGKFSKTNKDDLHMEIEIDCPSNMLILYSLENNRKDGDISKIDLWKNCSQNEFLGVMLLSYYNLELKELKSRVARIHECADNYGVTCSCFGTLGIYKYCILFKSDSIFNIVEFSNNVQSYIVTDKKHTSTSYTYVVCNQNNTHQYLADNTIDNRCVLMANIQITYKSTGIANVVLNKLLEELGFDPNTENKIISYTTATPHNTSV